MTDLTKLTLVELEKRIAEALECTSRHAVTRDFTECRCYSREVFR